MIHVQSVFADHKIFIKLLKQPTQVHSPLDRGPSEVAKDAFEAKANAAVICAFSG